MDRDGKIIKTYQFEVAVGSMLVLPPEKNKVLITLAKAHKLAIIDLVSQKVRIVIPNNTIIQPLFLLGEKALNYSYISDIK